MLNLQRGVLNIIIISFFQDSINKLCESLNLTECLEPSAKKDSIRHRNMCLVLGCLAEKMAGLWKKIFSYTNSFHIREIKVIILNIGVLSQKEKFLGPKSVVIM